MLVMIISVRWFLATNAGLTRNWLENGCIDQPSVLVWAVFGLSNAGQASIWLVTWGICNNYSVFLQIFDKMVQNFE